MNHWGTDTSFFLLPNTHVCAGSCWRDQSRARDETRRPSGQSDPQVCIQPTLSPWKQTDGRKTEELKCKPHISIPSYVLFLFAYQRDQAPCFLLPPIHREAKGQGQLQPCSRWWVVVPALAVCEAQVHAVAGEEGEAVQRELHAGRVRDGLAQQSRHSGSRRRRRAAAKRTHVTSTVENLEEQRRDFKFSYCHFQQNAHRKYLIRVFVVQSFRFLRASNSGSDRQLGQVFFNYLMILESEQFCCQQISLQEVDPSRTLDHHRENVPVGYYYRR